MMERLFSRIESKEGARDLEGEPRIETKVILEFMRHGKKEVDPSKPDEHIRLSADGRAQADARGDELSTQSEVALAVGSPRERTQETAARAMLYAHINDSAMALEEIENMIKEKSQHGNYGKKIVEDARLNFDISGPVGKSGLEAFKKGQYLLWLVGESDQQAEELRDTVSTTYIRQAGNVAEIVSKYAHVGNNFNRIASKTDKYKQYGNQLERYLGTHQGVVESFVAKVLEKTQSLATRDEFVRSIGGGFSETEGVHIEIINKGPEQRISMTYAIRDSDNGDRKEVVEFGIDILKDIITERTAFDKRVSGEVNI